MMMESSTSCADVHHTMQLLATVTESGAAAAVPGNDYGSTVHPVINIYSREDLSGIGSGRAGGGGDHVRKEGTTVLSDGAHVQPQKPLCSMPVGDQHPFGVSMLRFIQGDESYRGGGVGPALISCGRGEGGGLYLWRIVMNNEVSDGDDYQMDEMNGGKPSGIHLRLESSFKDW